MLKNLLALFFLLISANAFSQSFTSIWKTDNIGLNSSGANEITIPTNPAYTNYDYSVDWGDGSSNTNVTGDITHTYATSDTYTVSIGGIFPSIFFNNTNDKLKIIEILDWGTVEWQTMENAFYGCEKINFDAITSPDLSQVTSLKNMFREAIAFNGIVNNWDLSTITDISGIFRSARIFNRPLANWNTAAVTDMSYAFYDAEFFNEPLDNWITTEVTTMEGLFAEAEKFNQNINNWNVAKVTNMEATFRYARAFDKPLDNWAVNKVTTMARMFSSSPFNHPINNWVVDDVTDMSNMFSGGRYNQPLGDWNLSGVTTIASMFAGNNDFNQPINNWDVSDVTDMSATFGGAGGLKDFDQPLDQWDVSGVTNMSGMFESSTFNQPINSWDVSKVTNMNSMFSGWASSYITAFDLPLDQWDVSRVTDMSSMFEDSVFNQNIEMWNVASVTNLSGMFQGNQNFDQPLNNWVVDGVTNMRAMFSKAIIFNQSLSNWNTGIVYNMSSMFSNATAFDRNLASFDITSVTNMTNMLASSGLSQDNYDGTLIGWATQAVKPDVSLGAASLKYCDGRLARQDLIDNHGWDIVNDAVNCTNVFCTTITNPVAGDTNVPANSNIHWAATPNAMGYYIDLEVERGGLRSFVTINGTPANNYDVGNVQILTFTNEFTAGDTIYITVIPYNNEGPATGCNEMSFTVVPSWLNSPEAYKITIDTNHGGNFGLDKRQFEMKVNSDFTYDYSIDWGDNEYNNNVSNDLTHTYNTPGIYTIAVIGDFPAPYAGKWGHWGDGDKITSIDQWGTHQYQSMKGACYECEHMEYNATIPPNLSQVTDMSEMFEGAKKFNGDINDWDVSNVTNMRNLFSENIIFNQPLDNWVVSQVDDMSYMFFGAKKFNQPINSWDTSRVTTMQAMFRIASEFHQPLDNWNVSKVTDMASMFASTEDFNQNIAGWDVSSVENMYSMFYFAKAYNQPLNDWIVDKVTDMSYMFERTPIFDQPLDTWDVSQVTTMKHMFKKSEKFNQPIDSWNVSKVTDMASMFESAFEFDRPLDSWSVSRVISMAAMFKEALAFKKPLQSWNVNSVVSMNSMFEKAEAFNQPLDNWNVSAVADMSSMFKEAVFFDYPLNSWDLSSVTLTPSMFKGATRFNSPIGNWNVASVTNMEGMFYDAIAFTQPIQNWNTEEVLTMEEMFRGATAFNMPIDSWDVSYVQTMESMFEDAVAYSQPMNSWNVASVTTMEDMFHGATIFDSSIDAWNVRGVTTMEEMFSDATTFDQNINSWRVSGVSNMNSMFYGATAYDQAMNQWNLGNVSMRSTFYNATALDQNLGDWDVSQVNDMQDMLDNTALTRENYDSTLIAWSEQTLTSGISLGAEGLLYCDAQEQRQSMIDTYGWAISGDVLDCPIPVCTQLVTPLNNDINVPVNTNLTWAPVVFAKGYRLTVTKNPGNVTVVNNETVNDITYEFAANFNTGDVVFVTLIPFNDNGDAIGPCTEESYTISNNSATIPECTSLTEPLSNTSNVLVGTDLSWNPISNADGYKLTVGTSSDGNEILGPEDVGNITTYDLANNLPENVDIFVTITPYNDEGDAADCTAEKFKTELIPVPPTCTSLTSPANDSNGVAIDTHLNWDAVTNATGYLVIVGSTSGINDVVTNVDVGTATTYDIPDDLQENRPYYVTIIPYNDEGDAIDCAEEKFTTGDSTSPPSCTSLTMPTNTATAVLPSTNLTWSELSSATGYKLAVGTSADGTDIFDDDLGDVTTYDLAADLPESTPIFVTITPYNDNGDAIGCTAESFTTNGLPLCSNLITPANGVDNIAIDTSIEWSASINSDGYKLTVTASSSTANNLTGFNVTTGTSYDFANDFERGETVSITITPYNTVGDAIGCTSESFTIIPPPVPACTSLMTPAANTSNVAVDTNLEWNASTTADGYKLTVLASSSTANNVTDLNITTGTTHNFANNFEQGETVSVTIIPYNEVGNPMGCTTESFTIKPVPSCTTLSSPENESTGIAVATDITWNAITDATGYKLSVTGSASTENNLIDFDVTTGTTHHFTNNFEQGETVSVTITPYNEVGDAMDCTTESFTIKAVPTCTNLNSPVNKAIDVAVDTALDWAPITDATGYKLTVTASSSTANNLTNLEVKTGTTYNFPNNFEQGETVSVTIIPYNEAGDAMDCTSESFTIKSVPLCTNLISPKNGDVVAEVTDISWNSIINANGYKLTINGSSTTINNVTNLDVTGTTYTFLNDFNQGEVVTVTVTPYNEMGNAMDCTSESFTIRSIPSCTSLISPEGNATKVSVFSDIVWNANLDADGYRISIGTSPKGNEIVDNEDVVSLTNFTLAQDLPSESLIYVTIIPYNTAGNAEDCISESFETDVIIPDCTALVSPFNEENDVPLESSIRWEEIEKTDGYRLSIGTVPGGTDILNDQNMGNTTSYTPDKAYPFGTKIYVSIIPYNSKGDAVQCEAQSFTTLTPEDDTKYGFSPDGDGINEYWNIENIHYYPENVVTIYNRWGDAVFKVENYDNASAVFRGDANLKTKMGAGRLPAGTYFFDIQIEGETILKKTKGFLVIKR